MTRRSPTSLGSQLASSLLRYIARVSPPAALLMLSATTHVASAQGTAAPGTPREWRVTGPGAKEYAITLDSSRARTGKVSARIEARVFEPTSFVAITQRLDAAPLSGRTLRVTAWRQSDNVRTGGYLYITAVGAAQQAVGYANSEARALKGSYGMWIMDTLSLTVPSTAASVSLGWIVNGRGANWIDDVRIEVTGSGALTADTQVAADTLIVRPGFEEMLAFAGADSAVALAPPRVATTAAIDAMMALTRLTGYVRFFHPADSVVTTNWSAFLIDGMRKVENAANPTSLAGTLSALFADIAPQVRIFPSSAPSPRYAPVRPTDTTALGVAWWSHSGVGLPSSSFPANQGPYFSHRLIQPVRNGQLPIGANDPEAAPLRVDLGAGVSALIPLAMYTSVPVDAARRQATAPRTTNFGYSANDRPVRLAAIAELSMVMQHFYPYFDIAKTDWARETRRGFAAASKDSTPTLFQETLSRMLGALRDGHGNIVKAGSARGTYPVLFGWVENQLVVTRVMDTTVTGVRRGDVVVSVDGVPARQKLEAIEALLSASTPQWARSKSTSELARAVVGTVMQLRVRSGASAQTPIRNAQLKAGPMNTREDIPVDIRPDKIAELRPGVLYVDMGRITDDDFRFARSRLTSAQHIVFDMRGYPSFNTATLFPMLSDSLVMSAHFETPLTTMPDQQRVTYREGRWRLLPTKPRITAKTYFLTDGRAISYAESTMGIVEAYKLGEIIGTPTAGTNGNINPFVLPGDFTVYWTGMRVTKHDGSAHHGVGILPTIRAEPTIRGIWEGRDEVLEKALEVISTRK